MKTIVNLLFSLRSRLELFISVLINHEKKIFSINAASGIIYSKCESRNSCTCKAHSSIFAEKMSSELPQVQFVQSLLQLKTFLFHLFYLCTLTPNLRIYDNKSRRNMRVSSTELGLKCFNKKVFQYRPIFSTFRLYQTLMPIT